jgi:hypothetical protein
VKVSLTYVKIADIKKTIILASPATVQSVGNDSTQNLRSPFDYQQLQVKINRSQNSTPIISTPLPSMTNPKRLPSTSVTNDENERNLSLKYNRPNIISSSKQANGTVNHAVPSNTNISVGSGPRSAFRPFLKPGAFNSHTRPITPQVPMTINIRPYNPSQQVIPPSRFHHQPMVSSNLTHFSYQPPLSLDTTNFNFNSNYSVVPHQPYGSTKIKPDGTSHINALIHMVN